MDKKVKEALCSASYLTYHWRQYSFEQLEKEMVRVCGLCNKALGIPKNRIPDFYKNNPQSYRVKPEFKYRPFKDIEECWSEMQKHQPFGWIKNGGYWYNIITTGVMSVKIIDTRGAIATLYFSDLLANYRFADGTLFGVKVEE